MEHIGMRLNAGLEREWERMEQNGDDGFFYQFLGRLQSDCEYYLGHGGRQAKHLWTQDEASHIELMRRCYRLICQRYAPPEWITEEDIDRYAEAMNIN